MKKIKPFLESVGLKVNYAPKDDHKLLIGGEFKTKTKMRNWWKRNNELILWIIGVGIIIALALRGFGVI